MYEENLSEVIRSQNEEKKVMEVTVLPIYTHNVGS
jgi:hypothetical protein